MFQIHRSNKWWRTWLQCCSNNNSVWTCWPGDRNEDTAVCARSIEMHIAANDFCMLPEVVFFFHLRACINNTTAFNIYNFFSFYHLYNAICLMVYYNIIINLFTQQPKNSIMHYSTLEKCIHLWQFRRELSTQNLKYADLLRSMIQMKRQMVFLSLPYQESLVV